MGRILIATNSARPIADGEPRAGFFKSTSALASELASMMIKVRTKFALVLLPNLG
jgi:hypothetical protein